MFIRKEVKPMKCVLTFFVLLVVFSLIVLGGIQVDILLNPWLRDAMEQWQWYNYFTIRHSLTALYLSGSPLWLILPFVISLMTAIAACKAYRA